MAAKLVAEEGSLKGLVLSLEDGDQWIVGRDPDACQLLVEDPSASRKHLICRTTPQGILVENLSATNPTQVNDEDVKEPRLLQNGDLVKIGDGMFRFYAEATAQLFKDAPTDNPPTNTGSSLTPNGSESEGEVHQNGAEQQLPEEPLAAAPEAAEPAAAEPETTEPAAEPESSEPKAAEPETAEPKTVEPEVQETAEPEVQEKSESAESATEESKEPQEPPMEAVEEAPTNAIPATTTTPPNEESEAHEDERHDTIFDEEPSEKNALAEINFGLSDTGRWMLKVVGGPNNGAEFSMQTGSSYVIGTDPNACDIVFHDTSVSRQHARLSVGQDDALIIEDLKSRNGTMVDGEPLTGKRALNPNTLVSIGTTSFIVFDREGEMQTIISPLMPSIVKVLKEEEEPKKSVETPAPTPTESTPPVTTEPTPPMAVVVPPPPKSPESHHTTLGAFILIGILTGLFVIVGLGTAMLFKGEPVVITQMVDPYKALDSGMAPFPSVKYTFNKSTGQLLLVGHVLTMSDRNELLYALQGLNFIKNLDDSGIVIDEYVWREINQVIEKNPDWKGITLIASSPGHFVVSGYLKMRSQADRLYEYLNNNFPYPDLLEKRIVVDEEVMGSVNNILNAHNFKLVTAKLDNGEVILSGGVPMGKGDEVKTAVAQVKEVRGVRGVRNLIVEQAPDLALINISDKYEVSGFSNQGGNLSVVINGRILMKGDVLDGMSITKIQPNAVFLEKEGTKYRIDFMH